MRTQQEATAITEPTIIARAEHSISRANISDAALKVLYTLRDAGFEAYLVGGGVRDLLLGQQPKDFDVSTSASPEEVKELFRSCRLIGRRFRLAHVRVGREIVEVATFRAPPAQDTDDGDGLTVNGRIVRDNVYGTLEEDAWRRDFTLNCLYYSIEDFSVVDFTGGWADLEAKTIRLIGDPETRYREDPVRMLRAIRFAAKLDFTIERETLAAIPKCADLLSEMPPARLYDEVLKLFAGGAALQSYELLRRYDLLGFLFPETDSLIREDEWSSASKLVEKALQNTDKRIAEGKPVTPAFLFAALLWPPMKDDAEAAGFQGLTELQAYETAGSDVIARQVNHVAYPKRLAMITREIWGMQPRLVRQRGRRALGLMGRPRFRAAYDFLALRAEAGEPVREDVEWWTRVQEADGEERDQVLVDNGQPQKKNRRRRRRRGATEGDPGSDNQNSDTDTQAATEVQDHTYPDEEEEEGDNIGNRIDSGSDSSGSAEGKRQGGNRRGTGNRNARRRGRGGRGRRNRNGKRGGDNGQGGGGGNGGGPPVGSGAV